MKIKFVLINYSLDDLKYILYISDVQIMMGSYGTKIYKGNPIRNRYNKISWEK